MRDETTDMIMRAALAARAEDLRRTADFKRECAGALPGGTWTTFSPEQLCKLAELLEYGATDK